MASEKRLEGVGGPAWFFVLWTKGSGWEFMSASAPSLALRILRPLERLTDYAEEL